MTDKPAAPDDTSDDHPYWLQMWRDNTIGGFHQEATNEQLISCWHRQNLPPGSRILVPLCGKSLDMLWLQQQGFDVVGVELSPVAAKAFFQGLPLKPRKTRQGAFTRWSSPGLTIWCGDFFAIRTQQLGRFDAVFDRAALTALPAELRARYVAHLQTLMHAGTVIFLMTTEDATNTSRGQAPTSDDEVLALYRDLFHVQLLDTVYEDRGGHGLTDLKVYRMTARRDQTEESQPDR
ncbi:MAG TPA: thiopurine S-methyltransferase [Oceanospirillales bacterium]|nr:thiopurine S-methyltransferase [Oceanospirillales bacterium]|tara:strand:- start:30143 stop:30847 length:705 start_codon:yes stop_codon:yes gene_type:complete